MNAQVLTLRSARLLLVACTLWWSLFAAAQVPVPALTGHIVDQTATLSAEQKTTLEQTLVAFEARKGSQLAVLIVASTAPEEVEQFALRVAEKWKLGRKKVDDGAIVVVAKNDRAVRIEVGYGLEGGLNDLTSKRIISDVILPRFREQDFYGGIAAGVDQIVRVIDGEQLPVSGRVSAVNAANVGQYAPVLFIFALAAGGMLRSKLGKVTGSVVTGVTIGVVAWFLAGTLLVAVLAGGFGLLLTLLSGTMGGLGIGGYGYVGGMGRRGGMGGGGFSGGGGGFGGGGASGRW